MESDCSIVTFYGSWSLLFIYVGTRVAATSDSNERNLCTQQENRKCENARTVLPCQILALSVRSQWQAFTSAFTSRLQLYPARVHWKIARHTGSSVPSKNFVQLTERLIEMEGKNTMNFGLFFLDDIHKTCFLQSGKEFEVEYDPFDELIDF